jgi:hypothetical protein
MQTSTESGGEALTRRMGTADNDPQLRPRVWATRRGPMHRLPQLLIRAAVVSLAVATIIISGNGAFQAAKSGVTLVNQRAAVNWSDRQLYQQIETIRRDMAQVPAGSRVYPLYVDIEWQLRILELSIMNDLIVVDSPQHAEFNISVVNAWPSGARLLVERVR